MKVNKNIIIVSAFGYGSTRDINGCSSFPYVCFSENLKYIREKLMKYLKDDFVSTLEKAPSLSGTYSYKVSMYLPSSNKWMTFNFKGIDLMKKGVFK